MPLLDHEYAEVRAAAAKALGNVWRENHAPHRRAVEPLIAALEDSHADVREAAAWALGDFNDRRSKDALRAALHDEDHRVRDNAAGALRSMGEMPPAEY